MSAMSAFGAPQLGALPFGPFGVGAGSVHGSETGHGDFMAPMATGYPGAASVYGMPMGPAVPRNSVMTNLNMFGGGGGMGSQTGYPGAMAPPMGPLGMQQRPMSTFSLATTANAFSGPSNNPDPSDDELVNALRLYLSTQDLMTVTKK